MRFTIRTVLIKNFLPRKVPNIYLRVSAVSFNRSVNKPVNIKCPSEIWI